MNMHVIHQLIVIALLKYPFNVSFDIDINHIAVSVGLIIKSLPWIKIIKSEFVFIDLHL